MTIKETGEQRRLRMSELGRKGNLARTRKKLAARKSAAAGSTDDLAGNRLDIQVDAEGEASAPAAAVPPKKAKSKALPQLEIWERRLVDPDNRGSRDIVLKQKGLTLRIINTEVNGRYQEAIYRQGWVPLKLEQLADREQIAGLIDRGDGLVRTGPGGVYLYCFMPTDVYEAISRRKVEIGKGNRRSAQKQREMIMNRAAAHRPDGADQVAHLKGEITELIERVEMNEEDLTPDLPAATDPDAINRRELA